MNNIQENIYIYDSKARAKKKFEPLQPGVVNLYVCGMTVYDLCHIGHARTLIFFDFMVKFLRSCGFEVNYVRNITDIDDKIIKKALAANKSCDEITKLYISEMHKDEAALGITSPNFEPKATDHIEAMIRMIEKVFEQNLAYVSDSGDVCFKVSNFGGYGQLSKQTLEHLRSGARIAISEGKQDPLDFVLWKQAKPGEPAWDSPWGQGRPGWHIECSAMSTKALGNTLDIHGGGVDLQFPHHENEIAQSEGANKEVFANYWMHVGSLQIDKQKMSKSLGNFITIREVMKKYRKDVIRYFMLSTHYRHPVHFSNSGLDAAASAITKFYGALRAVGGDYNFDSNCENYAKFMLALADDYNAPLAITVLAEAQKKLNTALAASDMTLAAKYAGSLRAMGAVLGVLQEDPAAYLREGVSALDPAEIERLIAARDTARADKDWDLADKIRSELTANRVELEDTSAGTIWRIN
jgi:cysteinyl-tRNA synthetase